MNIHIMKYLPAIALSMIIGVAHADDKKNGWKIGDAALQMQIDNIELTPGPAGTAGADGATGPAGTAGADGATGPAGADGATGPAGADGATGLDGLDGQEGLPGDIGPPGLDGMQGLDGQDGVAFIYKVSSTIIMDTMQTEIEHKADCDIGDIAIGGGYNFDDPTLIVDTSTLIIVTSEPLGVSAQSWKIVLRSTELSRPSPLNVTVHAICATL